MLFADSVLPSVLREQEKNWPCYECSRRFVSSEQLQQHLNLHDNMIYSVSRYRPPSLCFIEAFDPKYHIFPPPPRSSLSSSTSRSRGRGRARGRKRFGTGRRPGRPPKFIRLDTPVEDETEKMTVTSSCFTTIRHVLISIYVKYGGASRYLNCHLVVFFFFFF